MKSGILMSFILALVLIGCGLAGCDKGNEKVIKESTVGHRSFIPLNIQGDPAERNEEILTAIKQFEDGHPGLEVLGWKPEVSGDKIRGLWVKHKVVAPGTPAVASK